MSRIYFKITQQQRLERRQRKLAPARACVCVCVQGENKEETRLATANNWWMSTWAIITRFSFLSHVTSSRDTNRVLVYLCTNVHSSTVQQKQPKYPSTGKLIN